MMEADSYAVDVLANENYIIPVPFDVDLSGFTSGSLAMSQDSHGNTYMVPSYSCVDVTMSFDSGLQDVHDSEDLVSFITSRIAGLPDKIGQAMDLGCCGPWDLRYNYIDGYLDSHKHDPLFPDAYSADLDEDVVSTLRFLRDACVDRRTTPHSNPCIDTTYYFNTDGRYFNDFVLGRTVTLHGFPEYLSNILDLGAPMPTIITSPLGDGDENFIFTNGFVISKANCGSDCMNTAIAWLNWQKIHHGLITSLGMDLSPQRPRYLLWSWAPFYELPQVKSHAPYHAFWNMQKKAIPLNTVELLPTQDAQFPALQAALLDGYTPP